MLAGLPLPLQQFSPLSLQLRSAQFQRPVLPVQLTAELDEVGHFFFERLDEVVSHGRYTVLEAVRTIMLVVSLGQRAHRVERKAFL